MITTATTSASRRAGLWWHRRRWVAVAGAAVVLASTAVGGAGPTTDARAASAATATSTWMQNGSDAAQSNRNTGETTLTTATLTGLVPDYSLSRVAAFGECGGGAFRRDLPVSNGTSLYYSDGARVVSVDLASSARRWRTPLSDSSGYSYVSSIAVSGGRVFVAGNGACYSTSNSSSFVRAYDAQTGTRLWDVHPIDPAVTSMAVTGTHVVVTGWDGGGDGPTAALDPATGTTQWSTAATGDGYRNCTATSNVFIVGDVIPLYCRNDNTGATYTTGVSLTSGAELWRKAADYQYWRGDGPAAATPRTIYASDSTGHLLSMRQDGTRVWRSSTETGRVLAAGPSRIYVTCDTGSLCALDRRTGARQWKATGVDPDHVALAADVVYPSPGYPLDAATGASVLDLSYPTYFNGRGTAAAVAAGHLWVVDGRSLDVYSLGS